jgi:hypothetical protein
MEDGGVKLLKERLEKFFHRVSVLDFIYSFTKTWRGVSVKLAVGVSG